MIQGFVGDVNALWIRVDSEEAQSCSDTTLDTEFTSAHPVTRIVKLFLYLVKSSCWF